MIFRMNALTGLGCYNMQKIPFGGTVENLFHLFRRHDSRDDCDQHMTQNASHTTEQMTPNALLILFEIPIFG